jgi:hypothetical protein
MASPRKSDDRTIARTYRAAIRIGDDFITLEETITLPLDAADDEVAQAVDLGWRIYRAQRAAAEAQIAEIRAAAGTPPAITVRDPDAPASERQRTYIGTLQESLGWSGEQLAAYAAEQHVDLIALTKGQASAFIDELKKLAEERASYTPAPQAAELARAGAPATPATERQLRALERLAVQHELDLAAETQRRYGVAPAQLRSDQASALISEWQRRPEPAL